MARSNTSLDKPKSVAIVSGKGGSGKTMVAAALAQALALESKRVLLVDADLGTGGLTYYLGFSAFDRARAGLTEFLLSKNSTASLQIAYPRPEVAASNPHLLNIALLPVGEHRLSDDVSDALTIQSIKRLISKTRGEFDVIIFDCRGGLDEDSIETCQAVDDVILVVETDAASIQATQYLANTLYEYEIGKKIAGFILNKVMDDPSSLANAGVSFFRTEYLGAVPFDIQTTRGFIRGEMPRVDSLFLRSVAAALLPVLGIRDSSRKYRPLSSYDFRSIDLRNPDSGFGGAAIGAIAVYAALGLALARYVGKFQFNDDQYIAIIAGLFGLVLVSLSDSFKQSIGRLFSSYRTIIFKLVGKPYN